MDGLLPLRTATLARLEIISKGACGCNPNHGPRRGRATVDPAPRDPNLRL